MRVKFCPMCKSTNISFDSRLEMTYDVCEDCGYRSMIGANFPEKEIKKNEVKNKSRKNI